jgi:hypothetical protein
MFRRLHFRQRLPLSLTPPWYREFYELFIWAGLHCLPVRGRMILSFPPEGTRPSVKEELRSLVRGDPLLCIYVDAPQALRLERVNARDGVSAINLAELENHSTEIEVKKQLHEVSDFAASNATSIEECIASIVQWAEKARLNPSQGST